MSEAGKFETGKIYQAIPAVMGELNAVGKNKKNFQQNFMYRGVDDVMNAINPALVKNKVFIVPEIMEQSREERQTAKGANLIYSICKMRFRFYAEDGSYVDAITIGEGMDSGDKATNKAMSVAFKYACFQIFCIPTEEMQDPDAESHETKPRQASNKGSGARKAQQNTNKPSRSQAPAQGKTAGEKAQNDAQANAAMAEEANNQLIDDMKKKVIRDTIRQKGLSEASILGHYKLQSFDDMRVAHWMNAMKLLEKYQDKERAS